MDAAAAGDKPSAAGAEKGEMKNILESFYKVQESEQPVEECGMMPQQMPQEEKGNPVTMNVSLNASGKENVDELIALMKMAGAPEAHELSQDDMPMIKKLPTPSDMDAMEMPCGMGEEEVEEAEGEWDNAPDEEYKTTQDVIKSGDDLHKSKKSYPPTNGGDNPMSLEDQIREELAAALGEKYASAAQRKAVHAAKDEDEKDN